MTRSPHAARVVAHPQGKKFIRYTATSAHHDGRLASRGVGLLRLRIIPSVIWATLAGNLVGMLPAYNLNRRWTWGKRGRSHLRTRDLPLRRDVGARHRLLSARGVVGAHEVTPTTGATCSTPASSPGTNLLCFGVFWVLKLLVFNRIFHVNRIEEIDEHLTVEERTASSRGSS